jgi:hypothetical protein
MNTAHFSKLFIAIAIIIASGFFITASRVSFAQQPATSITENQLTLTAIPPRLGEDNSIMLKPGEKKQVTIRVNNSSSETMKVRSTKQDFIVDEDGETPIIVTADDADNKWSLASWITLSPSSHTIKPQQSAQIEVLIEVPEDALPGGHYAMITHQPDLSGVENGDNALTSTQVTGINQRVGTLLYVIVEGPINEQAYITKFTVPEFLEFGPVPFSFTLENASDIHIRPQVAVEIRNIFGAKIATIQPETKNIFPFTSRSFEGKWDRIWGFGRYTAEAIIGYGTGGQVVSAKSSFWLIPIKLLIAVIVGVLLLVLAGMSIRRHLIHRKNDQSKRIAELETKLTELESEKMKKQQD